ncbi:hypothetical protein [Polyangium sp. y55x31]|uniref:hypothetical protein n=1 Tax=Polyangium sp. y55x31 TaxID=3042688 RepID=UPI00248314C8|nr:hypothetical protein [Polyangium sp. y55x31]MDI1479133.1 hypothetical protein [Polyangium sp. y55x31]
MTRTVCLRALFPLLLVACDPAGHLRVAVVRDGAGPVREPVANASVWLECPIGEKQKLGSMRAAGQFFTTQIPAVDLDCVVVIETPDGGGGRYRVRDLCVDEPLREGYGCKQAFLYVAVGRGPGG